MAIEISTASELQAIESDVSADYVLVNDIDASETSGWNGGAGFDPIWRPTGDIDGGGYNVDALYIDRSAESRVGFIGQTIDATFNLHDMTFSNADITGLNYVGVVCGDHRAGAISRCGVKSGTVTTETAVSTIAVAGGFAGFHNGGSFADCYSHADVVSTNNANYIGGFVSDVRGSATNCLSTGSITSTGSDINGFSRSVGGTVTDCYWDKDASGKATSESGTGLTTAQAKDFDTYDPEWDIATLGTWTTEVWKIDDDAEYPILGFESYPGGGGPAVINRGIRSGGNLNNAGILTGGRL